MYDELKKLINNFDFRERRKNPCFSSTKTYCTQHDTCTKCPLKPFLRERMTIRNSWIIKTKRP